MNEMKMSMIVLQVVQNLPKTTMASNDVDSQRIFIVVLIWEHVPMCIIVLSLIHI